MKRGLLILCCSLSTFLAGPPASTAAEPSTADCIHRQVTFDGITPLTYATVKPGATGHLNLHHDYPQACDAGDNTACASKAYLVSGDTVAIGKTCGAWAYVQFIGDRSISYGWTEAKQLVVRRTPPHPADISVHAAPYNELGVQRYPFKMVKGRGLPVCEAYLQRLNQTEFPNLPACGRPENIDVPGFSWLNRVWISTVEFNRLSDSIVFFLNNHTPSKNEGHRDYKGPIASFRYDPPVDIDNDGRPDNVLIFNDDNPNESACGAFTHGNDRSRWGQDAVILNAGGSQIDAARTTTVFGRSESAIKSTGLPTYGHNLPDHRRDFRPIGTFVSIFKYRDKAYFDTFYDSLGLGNFQGERATNTDPRLIDTLAVLLSEHGQTREMCEYFLLDNKQGK
jgi:hypothetical protein